MKSGFANCASGSADSLNSAVFEYWLVQLTQAGVTAAAVGILAVLNID